MNDIKVIDYKSHKKGYYVRLKIPDIENVKYNDIKTRGDFGETYRIIYQLEVCEGSYLHIGSGLVREPKKDGHYQLAAIDFMRDKFGKPLIPGSTLKGYTRDKYETLVPGCCWVTNTSRGVKPSSCDARRNKCCLACDLFGLNTVMGRAMFSDATIFKNSSFKEKILEIPRLMGPKLDNFESGSKKIYTEIEFKEDKKNARDAIWAVCPGAVFEGHIVVLNSDLEEVRRLLHSMFNFYSGFKIIIGHGKNIGLGHLKLISLKVERKKKPLGEYRGHTIKLDFESIQKDPIFSPVKMKSNFRWNVLETVQKLPKGSSYPEPVEKKYRRRG